MDNLTRDRVKMRFLRFFEGKTYPAIVSALAIVSSIFAVEIFLLPTLAALFFLASIFSRTARPLIITFIAAPLYISAWHSPSHTVSTVYGSGESDYLFTGWRFLILTLSAILITLGALLFFFKNKCYKRISLSRDKILAPALLLSVSFLLGGLLCKWYINGLVLAFAEACVFLLAYCFFAYGFSEDERADDLMNYFSYISCLVAITVIIQLLHLFLTSDIVFIGGINKEGIMLGWGIWTLIGITLAMQIPAIFYGSLRGGAAGFFSFALATLTLVFAILSMSRAAQLISLAVYVLSVCICAYKARNRLFYKIFSIVLLASLISVAIIFFDKIPSVISSFFDDNGRAEHAKIALDNFRSFPLFGVGFSGFEMISSLPESLAPMGPLPAMAHNTLLELLSATGVLGVAAYLLYRVATVVPVLKKRTLSGIFALASSSVVLVGGLVDNFPFDIYPMFYSLIALAIAHRTGENRE